MIIKTCMIQLQEVHWKEEHHDGFKLLNEMTLNKKQWESCKCDNPARTACMYELDHLNLLISKGESLAMKVDSMHANSTRIQFFNSVVCELCGIVGHSELDSHVSIEQTSYFNNYDYKPHNELYSNFYNYGWINHPNFSYMKTHSTYLTT